MERFVIILNGWKLLTIITKRSILDVAAALDPPLIIAVIFDWISKQQLNLLLFLSDWYCWKLWSTDLPDHDVKVMSDKKMICNSYQRNKGVNIDYSSLFSMMFKTKSKFVIVFVRLISEKWRKTDLPDHHGKVTSDINLILSS